MMTDAMATAAGMTPISQDDSTGPVIKNANYDLVLFAVDKLLAGRYADACFCIRCRSDISALALNYLPPHYYTEAHRGKSFGSPWVMIENAVSEAIERVRENPRHERRESSL